MNAPALSRWSRVFVLALVAGSVATFGGCYKSQMEAEKGRADAAEAKAKELEAKVATAEGAARQAQQQLQSLQQAGTQGMLVTLVNGQEVGRDAIRSVGPGRFVRNGERWRPTSAVQFVNGVLADQVMKVNRDNGKPNFEGAVKNSRPDGDWIWYDREGRPSTKEVWKDGKLAETHTNTSRDPAKPTWRAQSRADRDTWFRNSQAVFASLPELIRELAPAPAGPTGGSADGSKSTSTKSTSTKKAPSKSTGKK